MIRAVRLASAAVSARTTTCPASSSGLEQGLVWARRWDHSKASGTGSRTLLEEVMAEAAAGGGRWQAGNGDAEGATVGAATEQGESSPKPSPCSPARASWRLGTPSQRDGWREGQPPPMVRPFDLSPAQAWERFEAWQSSAHFLTPRGLLGSRCGAALAPELLPFWVFEATISVRHRGTLWISEDGPKGPVEVSETSKWSKERTISLAPEDPEMQVYASYSYRRDLASAASGAGLSFGSCRPLTLTEARKHRQAPRQAGWDEMRANGSNDNGADAYLLELRPAEMRQSIAWQLAFRSALDRQRQVALEELRAAHPTAKRITDVQLLPRVESRRGRLLHLPVFKASYVFGKEVNPDTGENEPVEFEAFVSGWRAPAGGPGPRQDAGVSAEMHFSPRRTQAVVAGTLGGAGLGAEALMDPLLGMDPGLLVYENGYLAAIALAMAHAGARLATGMQRQRHDKRLRADEEAEAATAAASGLGPMDLAEPWELQAVSDMEWRRWEEDGKFQWDPVKRRELAESLFQRQHRRALEQAAFQVRMEAAAVKAAQDAAREARRAAKYGASRHEYEHQVPQSRGGLGAGGRRDFKGYYRLLGLDAADAAELSEQDIKSAFREAAMDCHPDRQAQSSPAERDAAHERFQKLQVAYETLRDPKRRRAYLSGQILAEDIL